jgi:hypothetical protein
MAVTAQDRVATFCVVAFQLPGSMHLLLAWHSLHAGPSALPRGSHTASPDRPTRRNRERARYERTTLQAQGGLVACAGAREGGWSVLRRVTSGRTGIPYYRTGGKVRGYRSTEVWRRVDEIVRLPRAQRTLCHHGGATETLDTGPSRWHATRRWRVVEGACSAGQRLHPCREATNPTWASSDATYEAGNGLSRWCRHSSC